MSARVAADDHELTQSRAVRCRSGASQIYAVNQLRKSSQTQREGGRMQARKRNLPVNNESSEGAQLANTSTSG